MFGRNRTYLRVAALSAVITMTLAACAGMESSNVGQGPITLSQNVQACFASYLEEPAPGFFAVSGDGERCGYAYCSSAVVQGCRGNIRQLAIQSCQRSGKTCYVYAVRERVVWDGPVTRE